MQLFNELDANGVVVREGFTLSPYYKIPDGHSIVEYVDTPSFEQIIASYELAAQSNLDSVAQSRGYDSIESGVSYINSSNPQYATEAKALIAWRDIVWEWAIPALKNEVAGVTVGEFLTSFPDIPIKPIAF